MDKKILQIAAECGIDCDTDGDIWGSENGALLRFYHRAQEEALLTAAACLEAPDAPTDKFTRAVKDWLRRIAGKAHDESDNIKDIFSKT